MRCNPQILDPAHDFSKPTHLRCTCGNITDFWVEWLGNLHQPLAQDPHTGERIDYGRYENEGSQVSLEYAITCRVCGTRVAERPVTLQAGHWVRLAGFPTVTDITPIDRIPLTSTDPQITIAQWEIEFTFLGHRYHGIFCQIDDQWIPPTEWGRIDSDGTMSLGPWIHEDHTDEILNAIRTAHFDAHCLFPSSVLGAS